MQERVYQTCIHSVDELKQQLIQLWCNVDQDMTNTAIDQQCKKTLSRTMCSVYLLVGLRKGIWPVKFFQAGNCMATACMRACVDACTYDRFACVYV